METAERVRLVVAPLVEAAGATLYDLEYVQGVVRITVDREGGADIGLIGSLTREISRAMDEADPIAARYTLEVSSPGLERNLRRPDHFVGAIGSDVTVKVRPGLEGDRRVKGTLTAADDHEITVDTSATAPGTTRTIALADIERARTLFEWGPAPKPGSRPAKPTSAKKKAAKS